MASEITPVIIEGACMVEQPAERQRRLVLPNLRNVVAVGAVAAVLGGVFLAGRYSGDEVEPAMVPEPTTTTTQPPESYKELWATNTALAKAELNARLVSKERCIPYFVGTVTIAQAGQPKGVIENPVVFNDQDIFMPYKSHKLNVQPGIENYDYYPYAIIANNASASHEATYNVFLKDDKDMGFVFYAQDGQQVEAVGNMNTPNDFSDNLACTTEMELSRRSADQTYFLVMPDGTEIARYTPVSAQK